MISEARGADDSSHDSDRSGSPPDPQFRRDQLATKLSDTANELNEVYERLTTKSWPQPKQTIRALRKAGLEEVKEHIDEILTLLEDCQEFAESDTKEKKGIPRGKTEPDDDADTLPKALNHLKRALILAIQGWQNAHDAMEYPDPPEVRGEQYFMALCHLYQLHLHCNAVAVQMRGSAGLTS